MIASVLLASWLATQQWEWDEVPGATSYRLYWSATGKTWCPTSRVLVQTSACVSGRCSADIPMPTSPLAFIVVTAVIGTVEGSTEHGPVVVCP